jgi:hypothetical protein
MKSIKIKSTIDNREWGNSKADSVSESTFLENISKGKYGKPERWVREDKLEEYEKKITPIDTKDESILVDGFYVRERSYLLPADYKIEIKDLDHDLDYQNEIKLKLRKSLYGTVEEQLDMIYKDGLDKWIKHRDKIDKDNPLSEVIATEIKEIN